VEERRGRLQEQRGHLQETPNGMPATSSESGRLRAMDV
jgi:hypothetical protein